MTPCQEETILGGLDPAGQYRAHPGSAGYRAFSEGSGLIRERGSLRFRCSKVHTSLQFTITCNPECPLQSLLGYLENKFFVFGFDFFCPAPKWRNACSFFLPRMTLPHPPLFSGPQGASARAAPSRPPRGRITLKANKYSRAADPGLSSRGQGFAALGSEAEGSYAPVTPAKAQARKRMAREEGGGGECGRR